MGSCTERALHTVNTNRRIFGREHVYTVFGTILPVVALVHYKAKPPSLSACQGLHYPGSFFPFGVRLRDPGTPGSVGFANR